MASSNPARSNRAFHDREIVWFYRIEIRIVCLVLLLTITGEEVWPILFVLVALAGFLYFGWPLSAELVGSDSVLFKNCIRRVVVNADNLVSVKAVGARDYRAHIAFRTRHHLPVGYRCRQYTDASVLAEAMLQIVERSANAKTTDDALKLLKQVAKNNKKPLPLQ